MDPSHPGMTFGPIAGVVAAPGPAGPIGIGIGVPLLPGTPSSIVSQMGQFTSPQHPHKKLVSPDSTEDNGGHGHMFPQRSSPSLQPSLSPMTWTAQFPSNPGMPYPMLMGPTPTHHTFPDASVLYGLIGAPAAVQNHPMNMNIPQQNSMFSLQTSVAPSQVSLPLPLTQQTTPNIKPSISEEMRLETTNHPCTKESHDHESHHIKEIIHCKSCTLFPPNPCAPPPTTREKPLGCRTIFVGGLPENVTEEIVREIFERCGEITTIRMSKKNFCHLRFVLEESIEEALYFSGYRVRIGSNSDPPNGGRLHVDYAQARDDFFEYQCYQRQLEREQRHRDRIQKERLLPPSPPTIAGYSEHEGAIVAEKIKSDDGFIKGIQVLTTWLERGDCVKKNSSSIYSMIQSANSHVRRLLNEKTQNEAELQNAKALMRQRMTGLLLQLSQIEKVLNNACQKKSWDHFSKAQRKNIEMWKKQVSEIKHALLEDALAERNDEEMDLSDSETEQEGGTDQVPMKKPKRNNETVNHLQEENDSLRCLLQASSNEVGMMKADLKLELEEKEEQLRALRQKLEEQEEVLREIRQEKCPGGGRETLSESEVFINSTPEMCDSSSTQSSNQRKLNEDNHHNNGAKSNVAISGGEARLIGVISAFLNVHPFGASLDYIWSYTQTVLPTVQSNQLEALMIRFPTVFQQEISGVGAMLERKWVFVGFRPNGF